MSTPFDDPFLAACIELIGHTGAKRFGLRFHDDEQPVVWMALATHRRDGEDVTSVEAALTSRAAVFKLCETIVDGGHCTHCERPTGITRHFYRMPAEKEICWYQYDPELAKFRRSCEGGER